MHWAGVRSTALKRGGTTISLLNTCWSRDSGSQKVIKSKGSDQQNSMKYCCRQYRCKVQVFPIPLTRNEVTERPRRWDIEEKAIRARFWLSKSLKRNHFWANGNLNHWSTQFIVNVSGCYLEKTKEERKKGKDGGKRFLLIYWLSSTMTKT